MQAFSRGWSFLKQAWAMAFKDKDLLKPSIYALIVGMIVSVIGIIPIIGVAFLLGDSQFGQIIMGILSLSMIFVQYMITYIFSAMTVYLIYGYLAEGDGRMDHAWAIVRRDFFDILSLALVSTLVTWFRNATRNNRGRNNLFASLATGLLRSLGGVLEALWLETSYLVLPAMVIDDLNLKNGLQRIWNITKTKPAADRNRFRRHPLGDGLDRLHPRLRRIRHCPRHRRRSGVCNGRIWRNFNCGYRRRRVYLLRPRDDRKRDHVIHKRRVSHLLVSLGARSRKGANRRARYSRRRACSACRSVRLIKSNR